MVAQILTIAPIIPSHAQVMPDFIAAGGIGKTIKW
jgi:hypothetical protein